MSKLDANRSAEQRLDQFLKGISAPEIQGDGNQAAEKPSRWIKWGFSNAEETKPGYQLVKKSESKIFDRLLDRIDRGAGRARQQANQEITRMLKESGVEVTNEIKKHLPDKHKLGNAEKLAYEIKSAIATKEAAKKEAQGTSPLEYLHSQMPAILKSYLTDFIEKKEHPRDILRNKSPDKFIFQSYMQRLFRSKVNSFVQDFLNDLKKINGPMNKAQLVDLIYEKQNNFFHVITNSNQWITVKSMFEDECTNAAVESNQKNIISKLQMKIFIESTKDLSSSILTFASLNVFLGDAVASSAHELSTEFGRIMNTQNQNEIMEMRGYFSGCLNKIADKPANKNT